MFCESCSWLDMMLLQVLVSSAGSEAAAAPGSGLQGAGDLAGVSGRGSAELHQPGLSQLRAHQPEPQRPRTIQLWGRSGGLSCFFLVDEFTCSRTHEHTLKQVGINTRRILCQHTCACAHRCNQFKIESDLVVQKRMPPPYTSLYFNGMVYKLCFLNKKVLSLSLDGFTLHSIPVYNTQNHWTLPPHSCYTNDKTEREEEKNGMSVFVPGPNEASNAMNRLSGRFTTVSSGLKWAGDVWCGSASYWQDITQLRLTHSALPFMSARSVCITPSESRMHALH